MKVSYQFVCETVEVDVEEIWGEMLLDMDRREYNNNQSETRRHASLYEIDQDDDCIPADYSLEGEILQKEEMKELVKALEILSPEQLKLVRAIYFEGKSVASIAREKRVDESSIRERVSRINKKIKNILK